MSGFRLRAPGVGRTACALVGLGLLIGLLVANAQEPGPTNTIRIGVLKDGSYDVVSVPLETYISRVLAGEALPGSEPAALEALAITIRTYALGNRSRHRAEGFDLCDQTHCQVMRTATPATDRAATATAGQVLLYQGAPATVYYSASCGGRTEKPSNVWPGADDPPYLPSRDDDGCGGTPAWSTTLSLVDLQRALAGTGFSGRLRDVQIGSRNESGRVARLELSGLSPAQISGQDLRAAIGRTLGWQYLQSATFDLKRTGDSFRFTGHGAGHGVGMCVIGSAKLAVSGRSTAQILGQYFPGTTIGPIGPRLTAAPPERPSIASPVAAVSSPAAGPARAAPAVPVASGTDVLLALPEGDEGSRAMLTSLVRRERDDLAKALGVAAPARLTLRFHPTTDAYERATGRPWFTLGTVKDSELQFIPTASLRDRGMLERSVRRQLTRVLTDGELAQRPAWVREGAASHFSEGVSSLPVHPLCPDDAELLRPVSIGALGDASLRARACFERELTAGKSWRDVK